MSSPIHKFLFSPPPSPPRQHHHPAKGQKDRSSPIPSAVVAGDKVHTYTDSIVLDTPSHPDAPSPGHRSCSSTGPGLGPFSSLTSLKSYLFETDASGTCHDGQEHGYSPSYTYGRSEGFSCISPTDTQHRPRTLLGNRSGPVLKPKPMPADNTNTILTHGDEDDAYLSTKVPTPVKHIFELGPSLPVGMSARHSRTQSKSGAASHSRGPSLTINTTLGAASADRRCGHSRHQSQSKRKPSIMVHVEDADFDYEAEHSSSGSGSGSGSEIEVELGDVSATPKSKARSSSIAHGADTSPNGTPFLSPAPRKASWRMPTTLPPYSEHAHAHRPLSLPPQKSYAKMQYHKHSRAFSRPNVPSSPLPPYAFASSRYGPGGLQRAIVRSLARPQTIPKPLVRLVGLMLLALGCYWLMAHSHAEVEGRLTFTGAQFRHHISSQGEWVPRQARSDSMLVRAANPLSTRLAQYRPLPASHELLALQSYLLESTRNVIPANIDTSKALDAHLLLPISLLPVGGDGEATKTSDQSDPSGVSEPEDWLLELEREHQDDVVLWIMDPTSETSSSIRKMLEDVHGKKRHPAQINLKKRVQASAVLRRLGWEMDEAQGVLVVIGNQPYTAERLTSMSKQELEGIMRSVGWVAEKATTGKKRVLVQAQWKKKPELGGGHEEVAAANAKMRK